MTQETNEISSSNTSAIKLSEREQKEIINLENKIKEQTPARGTQLESASSFDFLPISEATRKGLRKCKFMKPTEIQIGAIPHALAGRDILGAAKTGSGKTLAFLIPILEKLYRLRWDVEDGLGALVISPTRELALQIFEVLRSIGKFHTFSAGLIIGGKNFIEEQYRIIRMNILVATPGRLLQHMEQTPQFDASTTQILVLDEADRILDMGFSKTIQSIVSYLPSSASRQTMLFSATQTKSVKDLALLSLQEPEYIAVHSKEISATPVSLSQNYAVCESHEKLSILYGFVKSHLKSKTIVFLSTCRQVQYYHTIFCKLQPGVSVYALHGKYTQQKRVEIYYNFLNKPHVLLFATDIAARGLDFPSVDWVLQLDCPENAENYIHRVGRTARYNKSGKALLCLEHTQVEGMLSELEAAKVPIQELKLNPKKIDGRGVDQKVKSIVAADKAINALAQKALMSYVRSLVLQPNKNIFKISPLTTKTENGTSNPLIEALAHSLGLAHAPQLQFLEKLKETGVDLRDELRGKKNTNRKLAALKEKIKHEKERKKLNKLASSGELMKNTASQVEGVGEEHEEDDADDGLMIVKRVHNWNEEEQESDEDDKLFDVDEEKAAKRLAKLKKNKAKLRIISSGIDTFNSSKIIFNDDGEAEKLADRIQARDLEDEQQDDADLAQKSKEFIDKVNKRLEQNDAIDRKLEKDRVQAKHHKKRMKLKGDREFDDNDHQVAILGASLSDESRVDNSEDETLSTVDSEQSEEMEDSDVEDKRYKKRQRVDVTSQEELALKLLQRR